MRRVVVVDMDSATKPGERFAIVYRCKTIAQAEAWVALREKIEPVNVHRGRYGIDDSGGDRS